MICCLGSADSLAPADQPAAAIKVATLDHFFGQFGHLVIFMRPNDVAINFLQVASQSALSRSLNYCSYK